MWPERKWRHNTSSTWLLFVPAIKHAYCWRCLRAPVSEMFPQCATETFRHVNDAMISPKYWALRLDKIMLRTPWLAARLVAHSRTARKLAIFDSWPLSAIAPLTMTIRVPSKNLLFVPQRFRTITTIAWEWSMSKFPCSLTRNMTSHSMENLTFHSLLRWKVIILQILATSLIQSLFERLGEYTFWAQEWKG